MSPTNSNFTISQRAISLRMAGTDVALRFTQRLTLSDDVKTQSGRLREGLKSSITDLNNNNYFYIYKLFMRNFAEPVRSRSPDISTQTFNSACRLKKSACHA
jgi:hypothetical protein